MTCEENTLTYPNAASPTHIVGWPSCNSSLISKLEEDSTIGATDGTGVNIRRIRVQSLIDKPIDIKKELHHSLVIFDDLEGLSKEHAAAVHQLMEDCCTMGRHHVISIMYLSHLLTDYKRTRLLLHECDTYCVFSAGTSQMQLKYLLERYAGADEGATAAIRKLPSRWCCVRKNFPLVAFYSCGAQMLHALQ